MNNRFSSKCWFVFLLIVSLAAVSRGQNAPPPVGQNVADMQFMQMPGLPTCTTGAVVSGDPTKGPSIILAKLAPGCVIPWHWHTPTENLMMVTGEGRAEMKDGRPATFRTGGFVQMPSQHVHQFGCARECTFYVSSDAAFDLHYVDGEGKDLTPDEALKKVAETAVKSPK